MCFIASLVTFPFDRAVEGTLTVEWWGNPESILINETCRETFKLKHSRRLIESDVRPRATLFVDHRANRCARRVHPRQRYSAVLGCRSRLQLGSAMEDGAVDGGRPWHLLTRHDREHNFCLIELKLCT